MINEPQLARIYPNSSSKRRTLCLPAIQVSMAATHTGESIARAACILATIGAETGELKWLEELGNAAYFRRYDGRMGNAPGEGAKFKGRGFVMITGHDNYLEADEALHIGLIAKPALAAKPDIAGQILTWYWSTRDVNELCDTSNWEGARRAINGGLNGFDAFTVIRKRAVEVLGS